MLLELVGCDGLAVRERLRLLAREGGVAEGLVALQVVVLAVPIAAGALQAVLYQLLFKVVVLEVLHEGEFVIANALCNRRRRLGADTALVQLLFAPRNEALHVDGLVLLVVGKHWKLAVVVAHRHVEQACALALEIASIFAAFAHPLSADRLILVLEKELLDIGGAPNLVVHQSIFFGLTEKFLH